MQECGIKVKDGVLVITFGASAQECQKLFHIGRGFRTQRWADKKQLLSWVSISLGPGSTMIVSAPFSRICPENAEWWSTSFSFRSGHWTATLECLFQVGTICFVSILELDFRAPWMSLYLFTGFLIMHEFIPQRSFVHSFRKKCTHSP